MGFLLHCAETDRHLRPTQNPSLVATLERLIAAGAAESSDDTELRSAPGPAHEDATIAEGARPR